MLTLKRPIIYDISSWEYPVDFGAMDPKPLRCIMRASIQPPPTRTRYTDKNVYEYVEECKTHSIPYGLYAFLSPNGIAEQAALYLAIWDKCGGSDMAPIVDVEIDLPKAYAGTIGNAVWQGHVKTFLDLIAAGTGQTPIIYTNRYYWSFVMTKRMFTLVPPPWTADYPLWVAQYPDEPDAAEFPTPMPAGWTRWAMWQYSDEGRSNGYLVNDLNVASDWYAMELGTVTPPPEPPEPPEPGTFAEGWNAALADVAAYVEGAKN